MIDELLSNVAPHHCCGCDKIGHLICYDCKNNITSEAETVCLGCHRPTAIGWLCKECHLPFSRAWVVGKRSGILQRLIGNYKFQRARSAYRDLGDLLIDILPDLPVDTVIVPVPTTPAHIRERGYDHTLLIARYLAKRLNLSCCQILHRVTDTKQRQSSAKQRDTQARLAFVADKISNKDCPYLLLDDVITTGSTVKYASKALSKAGAKNIWVVAIAYQPLG
jgi:ComF family protein